MSYEPQQVLPPELARALDGAGEGPDDWRIVKDYFLAQVGRLLTPPTRRLTIQKQRVEVR